MDKTKGIKLIKVKNKKKLMKVNPLINDMIEIKNCHCN